MIVYNFNDIRYLDFFTVLFEYQSVRMNLSEKHVSQLINGDVRLTPEIAERLEMVLGIPASFWNNLEAIYQEKLAKVKAENEMDTDKELIKKLPYSEMVKNKWVPEVKTQEQKVVELRKFFEVAKLTIIENPAITNIACRRLNESEKSDFALLAWSQQARRKAHNNFSIFLECCSMQERTLNMR